MIALQLTPFEEQILQVMARHASASWEAVGIASHGHNHFSWDEHWAGKPLQRPFTVMGSTMIGQTYPVLNSALGRLRIKGLVQRKTDTLMEQNGYRSGVWTLTDQGKLLCGVDPS